MNRAKIIFDLMLTSVTVVVQNLSIIISADGQWCGSH